MQRLQPFLITHSADQTVAVGKTLGKKLLPGQVLALVGALGSGKTTFVKGLASGLGMKEVDDVTSPTFVLLHRYPTKCPLFHLDLYRLNGLSDMEEIGWDDLIASGGIVAVEWAKKIDGYLPKDYLEIRFRFKNENEREISFHPHGAAYRNLLK